MKTLQRLWADQCGVIVSTELILVATILVIGVIVGLATVRDQALQELGDLALAVGGVNQSYTYNGQTGHSSASAGSEFDDRPDFCEGGESGGGDVAGLEPACIDIVVDYCMDPSMVTPKAEGFRPSPKNF